MNGRSLACVLLDYKPPILASLAVIDNAIKSSHARRRPESRRLVYRDGHLPAKKWEESHTESTFLTVCAYDAVHNYRMIQDSESDTARTDHVRLGTRYSNQSAHYISQANSRIVSIELLSVFVLACGSSCNLRLACELSM